MNKLQILLALVSVVVLTVPATSQQYVSTGKLVEFKNFQSKNISSRDVNVWVPTDYSPEKKYAVLYMHDGQMLFDGKSTWNGEEWNVDETIGNLEKKKQMTDCIVVAIPNSADRYYEYFPEKVLDYLPADSVADRSRYCADRYLKFIVDELKPFVDKNFSTYPDARHTFIMGSSMGGLISLYALCEYPDVFGGAACLSTHFPMVLDMDRRKADVWAKAFRDYLSVHLPAAGSHMIYMDRGDATVDSFYPAYQSAVDSLMRVKGWKQPEWISKVFPGADHSEKSWARRLQNPLLFLLANKESETVQRIDPPFWWTGMKNTKLQLMVYGTNISMYEPAIDCPGVIVEKVSRVESPNYLFIDLDITNARPGKFDIEFRKGQQRLTHTYELEGRREAAAQKKGFDSSDVVYLLMPDRFANGDAGNDHVKMDHPYAVDRKNMTVRHGGDLAGVEQHVDYLSELGITALWMTPVLESDMGDNSYHGYATTDYYRIDPRLGSNEEYARLVEKLHQKGIKVIMDMVFNHCGSNHPWLTDMPTSDWFNSTDMYVQTNHNKTVFFDPYASDIDRREMTDGWFVPTMPDLNQRNPFVANYLIQNSIWWIEYANLNGIRQDTYPYSDGAMMERWCEAVFAEYPDFNIVGEALIPNPTGAAYWQDNSRMNYEGNTHLKTVMDFHLQSIASKAFHEDTYWGGGLQSVFEHFVYDFCYPDIKNVMRLLENHDTDRFMVEAPENLNAFKQATTLLLTVPGIPQIYYGYEQAFYGSSKKDYGYIRQDMPGGWVGDTTDVFVPEGRTRIQQEAFQFTKKLLDWRKGNEVISQGTMKHFLPRKGVYVYERSYDGRDVLVVMNGMSHEVELPLAPYAEVLKGRVSGYDVLTGRNIALESELMLSPKAVLVLEL